jgi:hypothetical protein
MAEQKTGKPRSDSFLVLADITVIESLEVP